MAPKQKQSARSDSVTSDSNNDDTYLNRFKLIIQELLTDKAVLYPKTLMDGMDYLNSKIGDLSESLLAKDVRIAYVENKVGLLENKLDGYEQYSRRSNLRFLGIEEIVSDDQLEGTVIDIVNKQMCVSPPLQAGDIVRSHRVGVKRQSTETDRPRPVLVKFQSKQRRDEVFQQRSKLKATTNKGRVFVNEDLTARSTRLAYDARHLRKLGTILHTWTYNGNILIKDRKIKIFIVSMKSDFRRSKNCVSRLYT